MGRVKIHAIIAPPPAPGELIDGHELNVRDAEVHQVIEPRDGGLEGPGRGEGPDMEFVQDGGGERPRLPTLVLPREGLVLDHPRGAVHPRRLPRRTGVGQRLTPAPPRATPRL